MLVGIKLFLEFFHLFLNLHIHVSVNYRPEYNHNKKDFIPFHLNASINTF
ncbi:hypothetical protein DET1405 [Dehalococcoides mccartyi 195]|uniref:Uncharacterized protein n=1 Tax=Dehalococcoides mccartyi (strain ATCC BAA-2266 / KCTC 15142 / 195) TaxID=243164 RepID=Q3Z6N5_DEHM1|nr:hypothetical protein DET1405 [Dehalococcoides mccartyi 195]